MKILMYGDVHYCSSSSIVTNNNENGLSVRLLNCIQSVNWAEELAKKQNCSSIIMLGDFFDKSTLNAQELTGLSELKWAVNIPHYCLVGNHEIATANNLNNSANILSSYGIEIVSQPTQLTIENIVIGMLPFIVERDRKSLDAYFCKKSDIMFSHNDIKGINLGNFITKTGIEISDISANTKFFFNGHLHNGSKFYSNSVTTMYNVGNLTGQNFSENANIYSHGAYILDTDNYSVEFFENPFAFNFYKIKFPCKQTVWKNNSVISCTTTEQYKDMAKEYLGNISSSYRIIIESKTANNNENYEVDNLYVVDHIAKFKEFARERIVPSDTLEKELAVL